MPVRSEAIIFDWDDADDPDGNWQHTFEGHDVEPEEVEAFIERYWDVRAAWTPRGKDRFVVVGTSDTGRTLKAVVRVLDHRLPWVRVVTCYPLG